LISEIVSGNLKWFYPQTIHFKDATIITLKRNDRLALLARYSAAK
jgi:hypothetical protein